MPGSSTASSSRGSEGTWSLGGEGVRDGAGAPSWMLPNLEKNGASCSRNTRYTRWNKKTEKHAAGTSCTKIVFFGIDFAVSDTQYQTVALTREVPLVP
eukprot:1294549-Rhodomonas_salina.1